MMVGISGAVFYLFGLYKRLWRFFSLDDIVAVAKSAAITVVLFAACMFLLNRLENVPRSVPFIQFLLIVGFMSSARILYRKLLSAKEKSSRPTKWKIPAILVGINASSELFVRATVNDPEAPFELLGLVDTDGEYTGRKLHCLPVLGRVTEMTLVVERLRAAGMAPQRILISDQSRGVDKTCYVDPP
jgi:O-antigen biosynthesis protein WbqV